MADPFVSCPYNIAHRIPLSRIQGHIVKCQKNHPTYHTCPYNATHRYKTQDELKTHLSECPAKAAFCVTEEPKKMGHLTRYKPTLQKHYLPETDPNHEMWDK